MLKSVFLGLIGSALFFFFTVVFAANAASGEYVMANWTSAGVSLLMSSAAALLALDTCRERGMTLGDMFAEFSRRAALVALAAVLAYATAKLYIMAETAASPIVGVALSLVGLGFGIGALGSGFRAVGPKHRVRRLRGTPLKEF